MRLTGIRVSAMLTKAVVIALVGAVEASAQTSLSGAWTFTVDLDGSITYPAVTLMQDGMTLTGHYSSEGLGENDITGTVSEMKITIMFSADPGLGMVVGDHDRPVDPGKGLELGMVRFVQDKAFKGGQIDGKVAPHRGVGLILVTLRQG